MGKVFDALLRVLSVLVGVFGAIGAISTSIVGGALFIVSAILLWPDVGRKVAQSTGKKWLPIVASVVLALLVAPVVTVLTAPSAAEKEAQAEAKKAADAEKAAVTEQAKAEEAARKAEAEQERRKSDPKFQWQYQEIKDEMTGKPTNKAFMVSKNSLSLGFPYNGENRGVIQVRRHPTYGVDVIISVDKGQILCRSYENCKIQIRFDDGQPSTFAAVGSADNDATVIFLRNQSRFIESAKKAKEIFVQVIMHQEGNQVLRFGTMEPLVWRNK